MAKGHFSSLIILTYDYQYNMVEYWENAQLCRIFQSQPITIVKAKEIIRKIRLYPYWFPSQNQPFLHLISCCDEIQGMKLDQIKSHAFLQHSTLWLTQHVLFVSLLYEVVVNNYEKCQNSTSENSRVFPLSDLTEKIKFFCSSIFPFSVLICSHTSLHACCNNMGTSKVTHYMQTSPDKIFSLQNLRTSKVQVHCYIGEQLSCLVDAS